MVAEINRFIIKRLALKIYIYDDELGDKWYDTYTLQS